jgi:3-oxoacyl-[acyl-carrier protein] reductase
VNIRFKEQVAIVTGAGSGIGFEIARQLAREGAIVMLNDLHPERAAEAADRINEAANGSCVACAGNASDLDFIRMMVARATEQFGKVDLAVANAGVTYFGDFFTFGVEEFRKVMDLNLMGTFFLVQAVAQQMRRQESGGRVLLMSSTIGSRAYPYLTAYSMSKAAIQMMARSLVLELSPHNIAINVLAPGATLTERTREEDPEYAAVWSRLNPNGKIGLPEDMADAALFLLSPAARHITGQTLTIDGGWTGVARNPRVHLSNE